MDLSKNNAIGFIGAGAVGGSLAIGMSDNGYRVASISSRRAESAEYVASRIPGCTAYKKAQEVADSTNVVFITTTDDAIPEVASDTSWHTGQIVVHCSGAASLDVLDGASKQGAIAGSLHPIQAFSSMDTGSRSLRRTTFGIEGDEGVRSFLGQVALNLGGFPVFVSTEHKTMYHVSAVLMGNLLTVLASVAAQLWESIGSTRTDGISALSPMISQVAINLEASGIPGSLAGPYVRGDLGTINKHLSSLKATSPAILPLYCELALAGLPFTKEKDVLSAEKIDEIKSLIETYNPRTSPQT